VSRARLTLGLSLILVGAIPWAQRLGGTHGLLHLLFRWWPVGLIGLAFVNLLRGIRRPWIILGPALLAFLGVIGLLASLHAIHRGELERLWPVVPFGAGLALLYSNTQPISTVAREGILDIRAIARGNQVSCELDTLVYARLSAFVGDLTVDFTNELARGKSTVIDICAVFSQTHMHVPSCVRLDLQVDFLKWGKLTNRVLARPDKDDCPLLIVHITAVGSRLLFD